MPDNRRNYRRTCWIPDIATFAVRLILVRHEMGWNAKQAALACGIKPQSWREWEISGRQPRNYEALCHQIAAHTGCDLIWLMTGMTPDSGISPMPDNVQRPWRLALWRIGETEASA